MITDAFTFPNVIDRVSAEGLADLIINQGDNVLVTPAEIALNWSDAQIKTWIESFGYEWNDKLRMFDVVDTK